MELFATVWRCFVYNLTRQFGKQNKTKQNKTKNKTKQNKTKNRKVSINKIHHLQQYIPF